MSVWPTVNPACSSCPGTPEIEAVIDARPRDLGGFTVGRVLPSAARRLIVRSGRPALACEMRGPILFFS